MCEQVPRGYKAVPPSKRGKLGVVEEYTRDHTPKPKALWDPVGQAGACDDPKDGSSRFGFDDPMLRMQTPFFTFPVRCVFLWVHDSVFVHAVYESASHYVRCAMAGSL